MPERLTFSDAAKAAGISRQRLNRAIHLGHLPAQRGGGPGKPTWIAWADLQAWCAREGLPLPVTENRPQRAAPATPDVPALIQAHLERLDAIVAPIVDQAIDRVAERLTNRIQDPLLLRLERLEHLIRTERAAHDARPEHLERPEHDRRSTRREHPERLDEGVQAKAALVALLTLLFPEGRPIYPRTLYGWQTFPLAQMNQLLASEGLVIHATKTRAANRAIACTDAHGGVERFGLFELRRVEEGES